MLQTYFKMAVERNPELASLREEMLAQQQRPDQVGSLPDPTVRTGFFLNPVNDTDFLSRFAVGVSQSFPWFGTLDKRAKIEENAGTVLQESISARQLEIFSELQNLWFQYFTITHHSHITSEILQVVRDLEKVVTSRYETGRASRVDLLRLEMEEQRLISRIESFDDDIKPIQTRFNLLLNRDPDESVIVPASLPERELGYSREELLALARNQHPDYAKIEALRSQFKNRIDLAQLEGRPSFTIGLDYQGRHYNMLNLMNNRKEIFTGVATIRIPLFRTRYNAQKQEAEFRLRSTDYQETTLNNRLSSEIESTINELRDARRDHKLITEELVPRTRLALVLISEEYSNGQAQFDEVLQITRELLSLEMERVEKLMIQNRAMTVLEQITATSLSYIND